MRTALCILILTLAAQAKDIWDEALTVSSSSSAPLASSAVVPSSSAKQDSVKLGSSSSQSVSSSAIDVSSSVSAMVETSSSSVAVVSSSLSSSVEQSSSAVSSSSIAAPLSSSSSVASSSSYRSRKEILGPVKVSRVRGIDEMKGRYKSPRKALFMSLLVPGAGQMYVGGTTFNYVRGGLYMVTEVVLGGLWYHYSVTLYDRQVNRYEKYANAHFSVGKYEADIYSLYSQLSDNDERTEFQTQYLSGRETYCGSIYKNASQNDCSQADLRKGDNHRLQFPKDELLGTTVKKVNLYDETELYRTIGGVNYVYGWDDAGNYASASDLNLEADASEWVALGTSNNREAYLDMRDRATELANYQAYFLGGLILNHLISAVDATWSAYAHNKGLYEEKLAWYERIRFDSQVMLNSDIGSKVTARLDF